MTILNVTLTADALILSQDGAVCQPDGTLVGHVSKVITRPARRLVVASAGNFVFGVAVGAVLDMLPGEGIDALADAIPDALRHLRTAALCHDEQMVVIGGWSLTTDVPAAFVFRADEDFAAVPILAGVGHLISPSEAVITDWPGMLSASIAATQDEAVEEFHVMLALAQREAARRGLIPKPGWGPQTIGGDLTIVRLDRDGVTTQSLNVFGKEEVLHPLVPVFDTVGQMLAVRPALRPAA